MDRRQEKQRVTGIMQSSKSAKKFSKDAAYKHFSDHFLHNLIGLYAQSLTNQAAADLLDKGWAFLQDSNPQEGKICLKNVTEDLGTGNHLKTQVEVNITDIPFVVDSVRIELARNGHTINQFYTVAELPLLRDASGALQDNDGQSAEEPVQHELYAVFDVDWRGDEDYLTDLHKKLVKVLDDVKSAVSDWRPMQKALLSVVKTWQDSLVGDPRYDQAMLEEAKSFMMWLYEHFTFLGARTYVLKHDKDNKSYLELKSEKGAGLGLLRQKKYTTAITRPFLSQDRVHALSLDTDLFYFTKTNTKATVHRDAYTDLLGVRYFDKQGNIIGELRFVGLLSSDAYDSDPSKIPVLRKKIHDVMCRAAIRSRFASRLLQHILKSLPTDELFQAPTKNLRETAVGILQVQDLSRTVVFVRRDIFNSFYTVLVYTPKEYYNTRVRLVIESYFRVLFKSQEVSATPVFSESNLASVYFTIRVEPESKLVVNVSEMQAKIDSIVMPVREQLVQLIKRECDPRKAGLIIEKYVAAMPDKYLSNVVPQVAFLDIAELMKINSENPIHATLTKDQESSNGQVAAAWFLKIYQYQEAAVLADIMPILDNLGLKVIRERLFTIEYSEQETVSIIEIRLVVKNDKICLSPTRGQEVINCLIQVIQGKAYNEKLNQVLGMTDISCRQVELILSYLHYCKQTNFSLSFDYMVETFLRYPELLESLLHLFTIRFEQQDKKIADNAVESFLPKLHAKMESVSSLSEDRVFVRMEEMILATVRTNFYQRDRQALSIKVLPAMVSEMPLPHPAIETFVFSMRVVGVHLRMSKVARGGIRWSDRTEDYRTEVLGLMQAQDLKNAIIVPDGAKGVFVPKNLEQYVTAEDRYEEARVCYTIFIQALLEITDNYVSQDLVHPHAMMRHDGDDAYLVVAADKGTAKFSDTANSISQAYNFWLDDAFASGGKHGYDHKILGITAKGAWQSVMWHFAFCNKNPEQDEVSVVGIGDMSGDVFGNGMLLSKKIKLVAAFDHRHIFIDPNPDTEKSYAERKRLFALSRSSWADYDSACLSEGGAVYTREAKYIQISAQAASVLQIKHAKLTPNDLIQAILSAPVDLLWNGGIGTYVRSSTQTNRECGDPSNDGCRISALELRAAVIGEGGNLGFTQEARIEYLLHHGLMNTDFVDNAGGVMCSDNEVNIKILLQSLVQNNLLTFKERNVLLNKLIPDVTDLVLRNIYLQNLALSISEVGLLSKWEIYLRTIEAYTKSGHVDPDVDKLPDREAIAQRLANEQQPLTRAELAILLSRAKSLLVRSLKKTSFIDSKLCLCYLESAFPDLLRKKYHADIKKHPLRRDIVATQLANLCISDMGICYIQQMMDETGCQAEQAVIAYHIAVDIYDLRKVTGLLHNHAYNFERKIFLSIYDDIRSLLRHSAKWLIQNIPLTATDEDSETIKMLSKDIGQLRSLLFKRLQADMPEALMEKQAPLAEYGLPEDVEEKLLCLRYYSPLVNIAFAARSVDGVKADFMTIYYAVAKRLNINWMLEQVDDYDVDSVWTQAAKVGIICEIENLQRQMSVMVYTNIKSRQLTDETVVSFLHDAYGEGVSIWDDFFAEISALPTYNFSIFSVMLKRLQDLNRFFTEEALSE